MLVTLCYVEFAGWIKMRKKKKRKNEWNLKYFTKLMFCDYGKVLVWKFEHFGWLGLVNL